MHFINKRLGKLLFNVGREQEAVQVWTKTAPRTKSVARDIDEIGGVY